MVAGSLSLGVRRDREKAAVAEATRLNVQLEKKIAGARERSASIIFDKSEGMKARKKAIWVDEKSNQRFRQLFADEQKNQGSLETHEKVLEALEQANRLVASNDQRLAAKEAKRLKSEQREAAKRADKRVEWNTARATSSADTGTDGDSSSDGSPERTGAMDSEVGAERPMSYGSLGPANPLHQVRSEPALPPLRARVAQRKLARELSMQEKRDELAAKLATSMEEGAARREQLRGAQSHKVALDAQQYQQRSMKALSRREELFEEKKSHVESYMLSRSQSKPSTKRKQKMVEQNEKNLARVKNAVQRKEAIRDFAYLVRTVSIKMLEKRRAAFMERNADEQKKSTVAFRDKRDRRMEEAQMRRSAVSCSPSERNRVSLPPLDSTPTLVGDSIETEVSKTRSTLSPLRRTEVRTDPRIRSYKISPRKPHLLPEMDTYGDLADSAEILPGDYDFSLQSVEGFLAEQEEERKASVMPKDLVEEDEEVDQINRYLLMGEVPLAPPLAERESLGRRQQAQFKEIVQSSKENARASPIEADE